MHINEKFRLRDNGDIAKCIGRIRFGTLICATDDGFDATPIPWVVEQHGDEMHFIGHLANANPQLEHLRRMSNVLITFTGENAYVSPRGLPTPKSAPTWNYIAIHVHGECRLLDAPDTEAAVERLVQEMETGRVEPWRTEEMQERREKLLQFVTGVRIVATRIDAKQKLGQNERPEDFAAILSNLAAEGHHDLVACMREAISQHQKQS